MKLVKGGATKPSSTSSKNTSARSPISARTASGARSVAFEEFRDRLSPRAQAVKTLEMTCRRAISFARLCAEWTKVVGDPVLASCRPPLGSGHDHIKRLVKDVADPWWEEPVFKYEDAWDWAYTYWATGGHDRNLKAMMDQLPDENRKRVQKHREKVMK